MTLKRLNEIRDSVNKDMSFGFVDFTEVFNGLDEWDRLLNYAALAINVYGPNIEFEIQHHAHIPSAS